MLLQKNSDFQYYIYHIDAYYGKDIKVKYDVNISYILILLIRIESRKRIDFSTNPFIIENNVFINRVKKCFN